MISIWAYLCRHPSCGLDFDSAKARASHERIHETTIAERLWSRVDRNGPIPSHRPELGACWPWTGHTVDGYGRMVVDGRPQGTHRIALAEELGRPLLPGMDACHHCDNPPCCRPSHLFEALAVENVADRHEKGRDAAGEGNGRARLTSDQVAAIRQQLDRGQSWSAVARAFGVSKGTVQAIASGRTWRQIA